MAPESIFSDAELSELVEAIVKKLIDLGEQYNKATVEMREKILAQLRNISKSDFKGTPIS